MTSRIDSLPRAARPVLAALFVLLLVPPAHAYPGRWNPDPKDWRTPGDQLRHAVHLLLLPSDSNPYHSRILWWFHEYSGASGFRGGQWGWSPLVVDSCVAYPEANFTELTVPLSGVDLFCTSHAQLAQAGGQVLMAGGTSPETGFYGENKSRLFTPGSGSSGGSWSTPPDTFSNWTDSREKEGREI